MSRFHVIDTHTGVIVRQLNYLNPYRPAKRVYRRSWLHRQLATESGRLVLGITMALVIGGLSF